MDKLIATIGRMREDEKTYQFIGDKFGVNKGIIHRVFNSGYEPKDKAIRRKLGLEDLIVDFVRQVRTPKGTFGKEDAPTKHKLSEVQR